MKGKMNYKTKRNIIIIAVILVLFAVSAVSAYVYFSNDNETSAVSQVNSTQENQNGSEEQVAEEPAQNENNNEPVNNEENQEVAEPEETTEAREENSETVVTDGENAVVATNDNEEVATDNETYVPQTSVQTITTTEKTEETMTLVGFTPADVNIEVASLNAILPDINGELKLATLENNSYVATGKTITYNILVTGNAKNVEVSALIPEGTELVEGSISDNGILENGRIVWNVDVNGEKIVSFTVTVTKTEGEIVATAIVNGVVTNTVTNIIDEAPVLTVVDPNAYEMEIGTEYQEKGYSAIDKEDGDITDKVVLSYRFLPAGSSNWTDPETMDTNLLGEYKITYTVTDSAGNTVSGTRVVKIVDTTAPEITVKEDYVGNLDKNVFSQVSFKLYDNYKVDAFKINDGEWIDRTDNKWSDANFQNIKDMLVYGENTITLRDVSGNEAKYTFVYDNVAPTITVKEESIGDFERNIFSNVSFKLYDEYEINDFKINDGEWIDRTDNTWSDANFQNIKDMLVYGENTITLRDVAGNETEFTFVYDNVAPTITVKENSIGDFERNIFSNVSFSLFDEYGVVAYKINDTEWTPCSYNKWSDANFQNIKGRLVYGENTITLKDAAGNETTFTFTYDNVAPEITVVKELSKGDFERNIYSEVSFKLHDEYGVAAYKINDTEWTPCSYNQWSDANFQNIKGRLVYGENTITLKDVAGNEVTFKFTYDNVAPTITVKENSIGDFERNIFSNVSFSLYDEYGVVAYKINDTEWTPCSYNQWSDANFQNIKGRLVYGENTITLKDAAGNEVTFTFTYDNVAPEADKIQLINLNNTTSGYIKNKQEVRVNVTFTEEITTLPVLTIGNQTVVFEKIAGGNGEVIYQADLVLDAENNPELKEGVLAFTITGYKDVAGNEGKTSTEKDARNTLIFDMTKPQVVGAEDGKYYNEDITLSIKDANPGTIHLHKDGVLVKPYDPSMPLTEDGVYTAYASDLAGNKSETITFTIDKTKPQVVGAEDGKYYNEDITLSIKDANPGTIHLKKDGELVKPYDPSKPLTEDGVYTAYASDLAGNKSQTITFTIDKTKPVLVGAEDGKYYNEDITLSIKDANPGTIHLHKDGVLVKPYDPSKPLTEDGVYTAYVSDLAGNKSEEITFTIDKTKPVITGAENGKYYNHEVTLNVTDANPGTLHLKKDGKLIKNYKLGTPLTEEGEYNVYIVDLAGNKSETIIFTIDMTAPTAEITYSNKNGHEMTNKDVTATLVASEPIQDIEGWTRVDDKTFTKVFSENIKSSVEIKDLAGNVTVKKFEVKRIDKVAPEATVTYSNDNGHAMTNQDVTVTITTNESIKDIPGWTRVQDKVYTKVHSENGKYSVVITDKAGNTSTVNYEVKRIDKVGPVITLPTDNTFEVGVDVYTYPEAGSVYDEFDKEISFSKVNIEWFKANADGTKGEKVANFEWNTTLANRELGNYYIEYWVSDKAGNITRVHRILTLQDTTAPEVTLNGEKTMEIAQGAEFKDPGVASVTDNYDKNPSLTTVIYYSETGEDETFTTVESVDTSKLGVYNIYYKATDAQGNVNGDERRTVKVVDKVAPEIKVVDPNKYQMEAGTKYQEKGYSATDNHDGDITNKVVITYQFQAKGSNNWESKTVMDTNKLGVYKVIYTVKDSSGNEAQATRVVEIVDTTKPVIKVVSPNKYQIGLGEEYQEKGYSATDSHDGNITDKVVITYQFQAKGSNNWESKTVMDTNKLGVYKVIYTVKDSSGNEAQSSRVVEIIGQN